MFKVIVSYPKKSHDVALRNNGFIFFLKQSPFDFNLQNPDFKPTAAKTHFEVPFPVNYISRCLPTVPYTHEDFPK